jgi:hypothetical protein
LVNPKSTFLNDGRKEEWKMKEGGVVGSGMKKKLSRELEVQIRNPMQNIKLRKQQLRHEVAPALPTSCNSQAVVEELI